jgi:hypothetical protein
MLTRRNAYHLPMMFAPRNERRGDVMSNTKRVLGTRGPSLLPRKHLPRRIEKRVSDNSMQE